MKTIRLSRGMSATVDDADFEELSKYKWYSRTARLSGQHYAFRKIHLGGKRYKTIEMHRSLLGLTPEDKKYGYHQNGDTLDNRRNNLEVRAIIVVRSDCRTRSKCGVRGICFRQDRGKWMSSMKIDGKTKFLGLYDSPEDAHEAYAFAKKLRLGEQARVN